MYHEKNVMEHERQRFEGLLRECGVEISAKLQHFPTAIPANDSEDVSKINHLRIE